LLLLEKLGGNYHKRWDLKIQDHPITAGAIPPWTGFSQGESAQGRYKKFPYLSVDRFQNPGYQPNPNIN